MAGGSLMRVLPRSPGKFDWQSPYGLPLFLYGVALSTYLQYSQRLDRSTPASHRVVDAVEFRGIVQRPSPRCTRRGIRGSHRVRTAAFLAAFLAVAAACEVPTNRSSQLSVQLDSIPPLVSGDSLVLSARVLADADTVANAGIQFSSSDETVLLVNEDGKLFASKPGEADVTAAALTFADAQADTQTVRVRDVYELDSIAPQLVRFGSILDLFGVGLNQSLAATIGGADAIPHSYVPQDPRQRDRFGRLSLWVTPPAPAVSQAVLLGFEGILISDTILVTQRDVYEPNDTTPAQLGTIADSVFNPALAFERVRRGDGRLAVDWYTFTTTTPGDWTVSVWSPAGGSRFGAYVTNSLIWSSAVLDSDGAGLYAVAPGNWASGAGFRPCDGLGFFYPQYGEYAFTFEVPPDSAVIALKDLPAGTYHVLVNYGEGGPFYDPGANVSVIAVFVDSLNLVVPLPTGLWIKQGYRSYLDPDRFEENDHCGVAQSISVPDTLEQLSIDTPHDADWYAFSLSSGANVQFTVDVSENLADLDTYVIRDRRPDSLVVVDFGFGADAAAVTQTEGVFLDPGNYFLIVVDFLGLPSGYTLRSEILPTLPPTPAELQSLRDRLGARRRLLEQRREAIARGSTGPR
ncbi:MAG: hypothetical protein JSW71_14260 [Gemmatimonadota bacterium]|nr:MAG: hypothetical protein JSW71_14260 [Gemmatimonadota bacterium]